MSVSQIAQQFVAVKSGTVPVAELKTQGVIPDLFPRKNAYTVETLRSTTSVLVAKNIPFPLGFRTGRGCAQPLTGQEGLLPVVPADGDFSSDQLNVDRCVHVPDGQAINPRAQCPENNSPARLWRSGARHEVNA